MQQDIQKVLAHIDRFNELGTNVNLLARQVSHWSVGDHFEHVLMVNNLIADKLLGRDTTGQTREGINLIGRIVLLTGFIPRGRAQAPQNLTPNGKVSLPDLIASHRERLEQIDKSIDSMRQDSVRFKHPVFGGLDKMQWLRFMEVHTRHHMKIVDDILRHTLQ